MDESNIIYTVENSIATIRLNRPKSLNVLNSSINRDILNAIELVKGNPSVRVLIITGAGSKAFAAGADVNEMVEATPRYARKFCSLAVDINNAFESMPIPTIAAVGGLALGGGCELALSCDFRVGGSRTTMSFPEVGLGIIPGANGCARAVSILGPAKAKQLIMLTEMICGKKAYEIGLLNWFVIGNDELDTIAAEAKRALKAAKTTDDVDVLRKTYKAAENAAAVAEVDVIYAKALDVANQLIAKPGCALAAAKIAINTAANETISSGKVTETSEFSLLFNTDDQREGMTAMLEKRVANFKNK